MAEAAAPHLTAPDQGSWFARLDADQPNLRRAADHAAGQPDGTARVLRFGVALLRHWSARSRDAEALALLGPALRRPDARADPRLLAAALVAATFVAHSIDNQTARQLGEQAVALARQLGDDRLLVESLTAHGATYYLAGQLETALALGQEAVERARQLDDDVLLGGSLMVFLMSCYRVDPARSGPLFTEAVACTRRSGDQFIAYHLYNNEGVHALYAGDIPAARAHLEAAVRAGQAIGGKGHPVLSVNLGWVLRQESDQAAARSTFESALRISRRTGQRMGIAYANLGLACLAADRGRLAPGRHAARRRAGLDRPDRGTVAGTRGALPPRQPPPGARHSSAMTSSSPPTPRAWRSAPTTPSTWPSDRADLSS